MDDLSNIKGNSFKSKEAAKAPEKKVEAVVSGKARTKKNPGKKIKNAIVASDSKTIGSYIFADVLIPRLKDIIAETIKSSADIAIYGEAGASKRKQGSASKIQYNSLYNGPARTAPSLPQRNNSLDYDDIVFDTRGDAERVLEAMFDILNTYDSVSVLDLYDLADVSCTNYQANKYGWKALGGAKTERTRDGSYALVLPRATII